MKVRRKDIVFEALGFPIKLIGAPFKNVEGFEVLDINMKKFKEAIFKALIVKPAPLTGSELRFMRTHLQLTQKEFSNITKMKNQSSIAQWEKKKDKATGMSFHVEMGVRAILAEKVNIKLVIQVVEVLTHEFKQKAPIKPPLFDMKTISILKKHKETKTSSRVYN